MPKFWESPEGFVCMVRGVAFEPSGSQGRDALTARRIPQGTYQVAVGEQPERTLPDVLRRANELVEQAHRGVVVVPNV